MSQKAKTEFSTQFYTRIGGILYLIIIVAGVFGEIFVRGKLIVIGNVTATAKNIITHESLWRIGVATDMIMHLCDVPLMLVFYVLLKPVNKNLSTLLVLFNVVQTAVLVANKLNLLAVLFTANVAVKRLPNSELYHIAYMYIKMHNYGFAGGLIFFGCGCVISGYLIIRSGYLPKFLGVLMQLAGICYLGSNFSLIIAPAFANMFLPFILIPPFIAELSLCLWLLIKGVDQTIWNKYLKSETTP